MSRWNMPPSRRNPARSASKRGSRPPAASPTSSAKAKAATPRRPGFSTCSRTPRTDPRSPTSKKLSVSRPSPRSSSPIRRAVRRHRDGAREDSPAKDKTIRDEFTGKERQHRGLRQEAHGPDCVPLLPPKEGLAWRGQRTGLGHWPARFSPAAGQWRATATTTISSTTFSNRSFTTRWPPTADMKLGATASNAASRSLTAVCSSRSAITTGARPTSSCRTSCSPTTERIDEGDIGTGVLDVFDRYNFTVNEAEPLEKEVAIDPEMLGKVFENLIEENRRKGLGAFYTPREIVHYMCQESLINYLDTALIQDKTTRSPRRHRNLHLISANKSPTTKPWTPSMPSKCRKASSNTRG